MPKEYLKIIQYKGAALIRELTQYFANRTNVRRWIWLTLKADRVEALRKKFEAFLEEDKKRKQRNEYILGKLDKMCTCKALVPQYKSNIFLDAHGTVLHGRHVPFLDRYASNLFVLPSCANRFYPSNPRDDTQVINDIVQKYILIPRSQIGTDVKVEQPKQATQPKSAADDDTDWKKKYEILNQLQENEREEPTKLITPTKDLPTKYANEQPNKGINESIHTHETNLEPPEVCMLNIQEVPDSEDSKPIQLCYDPQKFTNSPLQVHEDPEIMALRENVKYDIADQLKTAGTMEQIESNLDAINPVYHDTKIKPVPTGPAGDGNNQVLHHVTLEKLQSTPESQATGIYEDFTQFSDVHNDFQGTHDSIVEDSGNTYFLQDNGFKSVEVKASIETINNFNPINNPMQQHTENSEQLEYTQYPTNIINSKEFTSIEGVVLEDGVIMNPEGYEGYEQSEHTEYPMCIVSPEELIPNDDTVQRHAVNINPEGYLESEESGHMQYPMNIINPEEFTPNDGVDLEDGVNINPEGYEGISNYGLVTLSDQSVVNPGNVEPDSSHVLGEVGIEENEIEKGIEEFEAEQRDMWHEAPGDVEYSHEAYEDPNQYYQKQAQEYPTEVNEYEETQVNYDQNYETQYVTQYEVDYQQEAQQFSQTQGYHEGYEQNYEDQPVYDGYNQEEYNQHQQQIHGTTQHIEQELDKEQGFVEKDEQKEAPNTNAPESSQNNGIDPREIK